MTDTVDLQVIGKDGDISRKDMSRKLADAFKQDESAFESLLDAAFGESGPYAAQSGVDSTLAEEGKQQLESVGLVCRIVEAGTNNEIGGAAPSAASIDAELPGVTDSVSAIAATSMAESVEKAESTLDAELDFTDEFATDESSDNEASVKKVASSLNEDTDLEFTDELAAAPDSTEASVKKVESTLDKDTDLEFTDELSSAEIEGTDPGSVKAIESELDAETELGFSDEFDTDEVGGASALSSAKNKDKPDIGSAEATDFSESLDDEVAPMLSKKAARNSRGDVPDALADTSFDDLEADLIDPAPAAKAEKKEPVKLDDGGLSLSDDDSAPLAAPKVKSEEPAVSFEDDSLGFADDDSNEEAQAAEPEDKLQAPVDDVADLPVVEKADEVLAETSSIEPAADKSEDLKSGADGDLTPGAEDSAKEDAAELKQSSLTSESTETPDAPDISTAPDVIDNTSADSIATDSTAAGEGDALGNLLADLNSKVGPATRVAAVSDGEANNSQADAGQSDISQSDNSSDNVPTGSDNADQDAPQTAAAQPVTPPAAAPASEVPAAPSASEAPATPAAPAAGLVLSGQINTGLMPDITPESELSESAGSAMNIDQVEEQASVGSSVVSEESAAVDNGASEESAKDLKPKASAKSKKKAATVKSKSGNTKKILAAVAGLAVLGGAGTFAFKNAGSLTSVVTDREDIAAAAAMSSVKDSSKNENQVRIETGELSENDDLATLSTEQLLVNLSVRSNASSIVELEPYFLESVNRARSGPRFGAAVPADSNSMSGRVPHPADEYFDDWSNREADLSLFLALLDSLIKKGELEVAQQLSDRAKDKLFAVLSAQRLARANSEAGNNDRVSRLMADAARDTFSIKAAEERVLAISDYALTEQTLGLNEDAMDTFLTTSILARSLAKPERKTVGLSSAARYFQRSGREKDAQKLLAEALDAGMELPANTAARDLAIRFVALTEARMGLFNQALEHAKQISDPVAAVSAYHGVALAIESTGDETNARKILNMAYRTGSKITDKEERTKLLANVVLAAESNGAETN